MFKENNVFEYELSIETANQDKKKKRGGQSITHFKIIAKRKEISSSDQILNFGSTRRSTLEAAIEALGVEGRGNIPKIIDEECLGTDGKPNIEFLEWAIQRGFQVQEWKRFSSDKNAQKGQRDAAKKGEKTYGFFGHWRKNILGASRQDWLRKDKLLGVLVDNLNNALSDYQRVVAKQELKKVIEKALLLDFLTSLEENEVVFATFRDKFGRWLHKELPATHAKYANGEYGASLKELSGKGYSSLLLYADDNYSLFGIDGFIEYQSKILLDPNDQRWELELQAILRPA